MRATELRQVAVFIRERYEPPIATMTPAKYVSHEAMHALADALESEADVVAETELMEAPRLRPAAIDESILRREALGLAVESQLGYGGPDALARAADTLVAFLRDGTTQPDPMLGVAKGVDGPGQPGAPRALHEAIDRAWRQIRDEGDLQTMDKDDDEDVLEQLRQLGTEEIARATFTLAIVRSLASSVRADRYAASEPFGEESVEK